MRVGNCAVRIGHLGAVSDRAPADQRTADGRRESTAPPALPKVYCEIHHNHQSSNMSK